MPVSLQTGPPSTYHFSLYYLLCGSGRSPLPPTAGPAASLSCFCSLHFLFSLLHSRAQILTGHTSLTVVTFSWHVFFFFFFPFFFFSPSLSSLTSSFFHFQKREVSSQTIWVFFSPSFFFLSSQSCTNKFIFQLSTRDGLRPNHMDVSRCTHSPPCWSRIACFPSMNIRAFMSTRM